MDIIEPGPRPISTTMGASTTITLTPLISAEELVAEVKRLRSSEDEAWTSHVHRPKVLDDGRIVCGVEKREWPCPDASDADVAAIALTVRKARLEAVAEILSLIQRDDDEPDFCDDAETCIDCAYVHGLRAAAGRLLDPEGS